MRTSNFGDWGGIRVQLQTNDSLRIESSANTNGFMVAVHSPMVWPNSARFIPTGSITAVVIKPTYSYTTSDVRRLTPEVRECLYAVKQF